MENKEFRIYVVFTLIVLMIFMASVDKLQKMNDKIDAMQQKIEGINATLVESDKIKEEFYVELQTFKENQDLYLEVQDWQITDVNEQLVVLDQKVDSIGNQRVVLSNEEIQLFESLVMAEAGGESLECQRAVASVVINRILHERFPKTLNGVIYQKNAFSVTIDGSLGKTEPTDSVKEAVRQAIQRDYTHNAIAFLNIDLAIEQGYENNVNNMLSSYQIDMKIDQITFLKEEK